MNRKDTDAQRVRLNELSNRGIGFCIAGHREPGRGLRESAYGESLAYELMLAGIGFERQMLKQGIKRVVVGNLFKDEKSAGRCFRQIRTLLRASVSLRSKSGI